MYKIIVTIATLFAYSGMFSQTWNTGTGAWISPLSKNIGIQKSLQVGDNLGTDSLWCKTDLNYFEGNVGIGTTTPEAKLHVSISDTLGSDIAHFENNIDNAIITVHTHSDSSALYLLQTEDFNAVYGLVGTTGEVIITTGLAAQAIQIDTNANVTIPDLAGSAQKLVTALADGTLDTMSVSFFGTGFTIDSLLNMYAGNGIGDSFSSGYRNLLIGEDAGGAISSGNINTAIGWHSMVNLSTGETNVGLGYHSGYNLTSGNGNTLIGTNAGDVLTDGDYNTFIGQTAGGLTNVNYCIAIGGGANPTDDNQCVIGSSINNVYLGYGVTRNNTVDVPLTIQATGGEGTNEIGFSLKAAGGKATGSAIGGDYVEQTSVPGASGTTLQTLGDRQRILAKYTTLTETTATPFARVNVPTSTIAGGEVLVTVQANDASDFQSRTLSFIWTAENKAGTTVIGLSTPLEAIALSSGTLTCAITATDAGSGNVDFNADCTSSLVQTTLRANAQVRKNYGTGSIAAQ